MSTVLKAVLFDLDDTLFDHQYAARVALAALSEQYRVFRQGPFEALERTYGHLLEVWHDKVLAGLITLQESRTERFRNLFLHYGVTVSLAEAAGASEQFRQSYVKAYRPVPGAVALLTRLKNAGLKIAVVTNSSTVEEQRAKLQICGLEPLVDVMIASAIVGVPKPHPAMFFAGLNVLACATDNVVMIGDSWRADILGAQGVGIRALWLNRYGNSCPDKTLAVEVATFEPLDQIVQLIYSPVVRAD